MAGLLLHWRPKHFLAAVGKAVPATAGVLIQFPFYGAIAMIITSAKNGAGVTRVGADRARLRQHLDPAQLSARDRHLFGSARFLRSVGRRQVDVEAPYVMQAANDLKVHLGWAVQVYNAAEALPNLINPFWMLPLLGVLGLRAREVVGFTFLQLLVHLPVVLFLLWLLAYTLDYHPPVVPS